MVKRCRDCGEEKKLTEFYAGPRNKTDGRDTYCKTCRSERSRKAYNAVLEDPYLLAIRQKQHRESKVRLQGLDEGGQLARERYQRYWAKLLADPKRHALHKERKRMFYHLNRERQGHDVVATKGRRKYPEPTFTIAADEFNVWLARRCAEFGWSHSEVAAAAGVDVSIIGHALSRGTISLDMADRLIVAAGGRLSTALSNPIRLPDKRRSVR